MGINLSISPLLWSLAGRHRSTIVELCLDYQTKESKKEKTRRIAYFNLKASRHEMTSQAFNFYFKNGNIFPAENGEQSLYML